jgi:hypothetical protein
LTNWFFWRGHIPVLLLPTMKALGRHLPEYGSLVVKSLAASGTPDLVGQYDHYQDKDHPAHNFEIYRYEITARVLHLRTL